ncbi:MAG TPA: hypothetical protein VLF18_13385 [Tahibacter sp.]|uniref:hypothetical protein n=1 Tax=Tahibacter sp. TaxID=2056211 RepID=UPI002C565523|nr:hypothetical protein [Tahibacter sp.]HSX61188.1 hypothetical protein [Tahibacter sp.]
MNDGKLAALWTFASLVSGAAYAQSCSPTAGALIDGPPISVDTCASSNQLLSACNGLDAIGTSPDTIYSLTLPAGATPTGGIHATPTGYDLKLSLLQAPCSGGSTCIRDADSGGVGAQENFSVAGLVGPQSFFLLLTSFGGSPDCGVTTITVTPPVPITLQKFSID